jgi:hypothetical protein
MFRLHRATSGLTARFIGRTMSSTGVRHAISPYSYFILQTYKTPSRVAALKRLTVNARWKQMAVWWHALSAEQKAIMKYQAGKVPSFKRTKKQRRAKRPLTSYNKHISRCMLSKKLAHLPVTLRFKAAAKLWKC